MGIIVEDTLEDIYVKTIIKHEDLSNEDKDVIYKEMLNFLINPEGKYNIYLKQTKQEAFRILNLFEKWYKSNTISLNEYKKFYNETLKPSFKYDVYSFIYIFFHPNVMADNFSETGMEFETDFDRRKLCSIDFIVNIFCDYFYFNVLSFEGFEEDDMIWDYVYVDPIPSILKKEKYTCISAYGEYVSIFDAKDFNEEEQRRSDPRWLYNNILFSKDLQRNYNKDNIALPLNTYNHM